MTTDLLIADLYLGDDPQPTWSTAVAAPQLRGAILKATEATAAGHYGTDYLEWFRKQWTPLREAAAPRYGTTWFRGAYHFYAFYAGGGTPEAQADFFLRTVEAGGGWGPGDLPPIIDVEIADEDGRPPPSPSPQQIVDLISAYTAKVKQALGCPMILYSGETLRERGITDHLGCDHLWTAQYAGALSPTTYTEMGWTDAETVLWQYTDGTTNYTRNPTRLAGLGGDLSVVRTTDLAALTWLRGSSN